MKRLLVSAIAVLCLSAGALSQDPAIKVSLELKATNAVSAIEQLSKATGEKLSAAPAMSSEIVLIAVKDVPLGDLMERIAKVTSGEWRDDPEGGKKLVPANARSTELRLEQGERLGNIRKAIASLVDKAAKAEKAAGEEEAADAMGMGFDMPSFMGGTNVRGPQGKAIVRLVRGIDPGLLAAIPEGGRLVFSTQPTMMQRPLTQNVGPMVAELVKAHNDRFDLMEKRRQDRQTDPGQGSEEMEQMMSMFSSMFGEMPKPKRIEGAPAKLLLVFENGGGAGPMAMFAGGGLSAGIKLFDAQGKVLMTSSVALEVNNTMIRRAMELAEEGKKEEEEVKPVEPGDEKPITLSKLTKEIQHALSIEDIESTFEKKLSDEATAILSRPDLHDPLSFEQSETLLAVADAKKLNIVANLPDGMTSGFALFMPEMESSATVGEAMESLKTNDEIKLSVEGGWMVIQPARPVQSRTKRVDRVALRALIEASRDKVVPALDDIAEYAAKNGPPMESAVSSRYLMYFAPNALMSGMGAILDWDMLRLYGQLGQARRMALQRGEKFSFGAMAGEPGRTLGKMLFGTAAKLEAVDAKKPETQGGFFEMIAQFIPKPSVDYRDEPTEVMPGGLPAMGTIEVSVEDDNMAVIHGSGAAISRAFGALGADEIAMFKWMSEDANFGQMAGESIPKIENVQVGERRVLTFTFRVGNGVVARRTLHDDRVDKNAKPVPMSALPPAFQAKIAKRVEAMKKSPFPFFMGMGSQGAKP